jgi:hypothetical protein
VILFFLKVVNSGYKCQMVVRVLATENIHKGNLGYLLIKPWRLKSLVRGLNLLKCPLQHKSLAYKN